MTEAVFWGAFLFFAAVRAWSPEIYWGEKPMDFAILNSLLRCELLPPPEPWFSGTTLSYTYFGHFLVAAFAKALGVHPALAFNLGARLDRRADRRRPPSPPARSSAAASGPASSPSSSASSPATSPGSSSSRVDEASTSTSSGRSLAS